MEKKILEAFLLESKCNLAIHHKKNRFTNSVVNDTSLNHEVSKVIN